MSSPRLAPALDQLRRGGMIVLTDDADRENEGDLCLAAERVSDQAINFMARHGRGLICLSLTRARTEELGLPMMVADNTSAFGTGFTVSIEARRGVTTGISAGDRCRTIRAAIDPRSGPADLARPGHIFPLRAREGGVLTRRGQTEGSVDACVLAGLGPAAVICEIMADDGTMMRGDALATYAERWALPMLAVEELAEERWAQRRWVEAAGDLAVAHPTLGQLGVRRWRTAFDGAHHATVARGAEGGPAEVWVVMPPAGPVDTLAHLMAGAGADLEGAGGALASAMRALWVAPAPACGQDQAWPLVGQLLAAAGVEEVARLWAPPALLAAQARARPGGLPAVRESRPVDPSPWRW